MASVAEVSRMQPSLEGGNGNFFIDIADASYENKTGIGLVSIMHWRIGH